MMNEDDTETAEAYALLRGFELTGHLGSGLNGRVYLFYNLLVNKCRLNHI